MDGNNHNTEDRGWWYIHGEGLEKKFVSVFSDRLKLDAKINPAKTFDKTAPDLIVDGVVSDLKTQNTPFFTALRYGILPKYAVTFNRKDYTRYLNKYPDIDIYFWVDWHQTQWNGETVDYLGGVYKVPFRTLASLIERPAPEHHYKRRAVAGDVNAKSSFILDVREFETLFETESRG